VTRLPITSARNPQLKAVRRLRHARSRDTLVLAEGRRQLERALAAGLCVTHVYAAPPLFLGAGDELLVREAERHGARIVELGADAFRSIASRSRPDGIAAVVERPRTRLRDLTPGLVAVAAGVERPGNLGAVARTSEAAGAAALVVCDAATDPFHPDSVRGSVGTVFTLPVVTASSGETLAWIHEHSIRLVIATPDGRQPVWGADFAAPGTAVVVGGERYGVGAEWIAAADETVSIPMAGSADSLNVAVAAGIVLFEAARQRASARRT
jgi:TrmH family RNA methyltransferase